MPTLQSHKVLYGKITKTQNKKGGRKGFPPHMHRYTENTMPARIRTRSAVKILLEEED